MRDDLELDKLIVRFLFCFTKCYKKLDFFFGFLKKVFANCIFSKKNFENFLNNEIEVLNF